MFVVIVDAVVGMAGGIGVSVEVWARMAVVEMRRADLEVVDCWNLLDIDSCLDVFVESTYDYLVKTGLFAQSAHAL